MKLVKTWKGMTVQEIIARKNGRTNGGHYMTDDIIWQYRTDYLRNGTFDDQGPCQCGPNRADCITIEVPGGILARLNLTYFFDKKIINRPAQSRQRSKI